MDKNKLLKLAKMVMQFTECQTDKGTLTFDGELAVGTEVYIEVDGEYQPVKDDDYFTETQKITVKDGKVEEIEAIEMPKPEHIEEIEDMAGMGEELEPEPTIEPEPTVEPDERDTKIAELQAEVARLTEEIAVKDGEIEQLKGENEQLKTEVETLKNKPVEEPIKMNKTDLQPFTNTENKALKYFQ